ncbi:phage minor head protein [Piscirickettsia litoralis]|uniref:Phage head morphogenesis domain-containing protein n=1 Tax=Piscirickettsia litoralis TaxID=1891921 RepID=A0ABX3A1A6_9GAMM|nr:phage minor head protein [Piscirickettsia litoralis]ODN41230.1 hypothetical protein BGC07_17605 [Piscirickettsia litoralis]
MENKALSTNALIDQTKPSFKEAFLSAVTAAHIHTSASALNKAIKKGDLQQVLDAVGYSYLVAELSTLYSVEQSAVKAGADNARFALPEYLEKKTPPLNMLDDYVQQIIKDRTAELVTLVSYDTKEAIAAQVSEGFSEGEHVRVMSARIKSLVGLNRPQQGAMNKFIDNLLEKEIKPDVLDKMILTEYNKKLNYRSLMIARTESSFAIHAGREAMWQDMVHKGIISPQSKKQWLTCDDSRVSKFICRPMNKQTVLVGQPFTTGDGRAVYHPPETHPNCRCTVVLKPVS